HPDTLVHLMDRTIDDVFRELASPTSARRRQPPIKADICACGRNPLLAYFATATLAFQHTLALCADRIPITSIEADLVERAVTRVGRREITLFCALCRQREDHHTHCPVSREHPPTSHAHAAIPIAARPA
ncbi:MAG: hypothetical protein ABW223_07230, partial [Rariglobus sp.]